jgi:hypothetical protein
MGATPVTDSEKSEVQHQLWHIAKDVAAHYARMGRRIRRIERIAGIGPVFLGGPPYQQDGVKGLSKAERVATLLRRPQGITRAELVEIVGFSKADYYVRSMAQTRCIRVITISPNRHWRGIPARRSLRLVTRSA